MNWATSSVFWFGQATSNGDASTDYADVRVAYDAQNLYVFATIVDYYLWYDSTGTSDPRTYDAFGVYLDTQNSRAGAPTTADYFMVSGYHSQPPGNDPRWQRRGQGTGSGWNEGWTPSPAWTDGIGERYYNSGPNNNSDLDAGWATTMTIPWTTIGLSGPPAAGTTFGMGAILYKRNNQSAASVVAPEVWPETFQTSAPSTWGALTFNPPGFQPPAAANTQTVSLVRGTNNEAVQDAYVGGGGTCGGGIYGGGDTPHPTDNLFVQNEADVSDFPCFSKIYLQFDLSQIPPGKVITGASLVLHEYGSSNPSQAQPSDVQVFRITDSWSETTLTWTNAPLAAANYPGTTVNPESFPGDWTKIPAYTWDVTQLVAQAYAAGGPANLALYDSDQAYHSGKYFVASDTGDWNAANRPSLTVTYGDPALGVSLAANPVVPNQNDVVTYTFVVNGAGQSVQVAVPIASQLTYVSGSATNGATYNSSSQTVQWSGTPAAGQPATISFQAKVNVASPTFVVTTASASDVNGATASSSVNLLLNPYSSSLPVVK